MISSLNITAYPISGICKSGGGDVMVTVSAIEEEESINSEDSSDQQVSEELSKEEETTETPSMEEELSNGTFACDENGEFLGTMDLSDIDSEVESLKIEITQGSNRVTVDDSDIPLNDQIGLVSAPTATAPAGTVGGSDLLFSLEVDCNELKNR